MLKLSNICSSLKTTKSVGQDNIAMQVIKNTFDIISAPLANIINLSLSQGLFPEKLKIAKLIPVFKSGETQHFINYRPISILSNLSRCFEKVMHSHIVFFLERLAILYFR